MLGLPPFMIFYWITTLLVYLLYAAISERRPWRQRGTEILFLTLILFLGLPLPCIDGSCGRSADMFGLPVTIVYYWIAVLLAYLLFAAITKARPWRDRGSEIVLLLLFLFLGSSLLFGISGPPGRVLTIADLGRTLRSAFILTLFLVSPISLAYIPALIMMRIMEVPDWVKAIILLPFFLVQVFWVVALMTSDPI